MRRQEKTTSFKERLTKYADDILTDSQKVSIEKRKYFLENKDAIIIAKDEGYGNNVIADFCTQELLKTDIPKSFTWKNKEGEDQVVETRFYPNEIKKLTESENEV